MKSELPALVVVVSRFPYPLEKGDKLRAYYQIKEFSKNYSVHLIALSDEKVNDTSKQELEKYCQSVTIYQLSFFSRLMNSGLALLGNNPIQVGYFYNYFAVKKIRHQLEIIQPSFIFSQLIRTTEYTKNYHSCFKVIDYMDALSKGMERRISTAPWFLKLFYQLESKRLRNYERSVFDYFDQQIIISEQDKQFVFHPDKAKIKCIPNGIDSYFLEQLTIEKTNDFVFVGNMSYLPNVEAALYIIEKILPNFSNATLLIAGVNPHPRILKAAKNNSKITISGWVDDIRTAYLSAKICLAPMQSGTGMQNKLLEAMALGLPCVTTSLANNAIKAIDNESIIVCNQLDEFIHQLNWLLENQQVREQIGQNAKEFVANQYSWEETVKNIFPVV